VGVHRTIRGALTGGIDICEDLLIHGRQPSVDDINMGVSWN